MDRPAAEPAPRFGLADEALASQPTIYAAGALDGQVVVVSGGAGGLGRAAAWLFARLGAFFGGLAALLVAVGLYGTLAYRVSRRTLEIGVRMALGAARQQVLWMILQDSLILIAAGLVVGLPLAWFGSRVMATMLYKLPAHDPVSFVAAALGVVGVSVGAALLPARRAASVEPMQALRME